MERIVLVIASLLIFQFSITVDAQYTFLHEYCTETSPSYTHGSVYENNLHLLLNNLASESSSLKFYNSTIGVGSDKVYGLFQCRYDLVFDECNACVNHASKKIVEACPLYGEAIVWYKECMLRYASHNIFSLYQSSPLTYLRHAINISNYDQYAPILATTLKNLIKNASSALPYYGSGITNWTSFETLYTFAQCTPDIDKFGCNSCLKFALSTMNVCCNQSTSVMVFSPSCALWYDLSPFLKDQFPRDHSLAEPPSFQQSPPYLSVPPTKGRPSKSLLIIIVASVSAALLILAVVLCICLRRRKPNKASSSVPPTSSTKLHDNVNGKTDAENRPGGTEFIEYDFKTLKTATKDFANENMFGEGGFGIVYKGTLENGEQLAIKRLSDTSRQGTKEFMAEAHFLAKLQHKNLVKLVGFCSEKEEKLLVYEFMSNASLERFLFDTGKKHLLNWATRYKIIMGIARGLQYLHEDSRVTIIHRNLKPSNILLDKDMNPKIADFGLAKLFESAQKFGSTNNIVGTQGYMAPEYMMTGNFSNKSDIYSFGIMLLEIVSGQNNIRFYQSPQKEDLPIHAWRLWKEGRPFDIVDPVLYNNCPNDEVTRCIQIGLLCLEENVEHRPAMTLVVHMLTGSIDIPMPSTPAMSFPQFSMPKVSNSTIEHRSGIYMATDLYPQPR